MGTSNSYGGTGGGTPLIPSWLGSDQSDGGRGAPPVVPPSDGNDAPSPANGAPPDASPDGVTPPQPGGVPAASKLVPMPTAGDANRFTAARSNFTRFINSGGQDRRALGRALSSYVGTSMGGSRSAARRMVPSSEAATRLADFLGTAATSGVREALRSIGLERLAGRPMGEVLRGMTEFICPPGGSIDESIAREAFIETLADLAESGVSDLEALTPDQMQTVLELNIAHALEARICNDIGTNAIALPESPEAAAAIQEQLFDFVQGSVADAFSATPLGQGLAAQETQVVIDRIYEQAFGVLQTLADAEVEK